MSVSAICMKGLRLLLRNRPIAPRGLLSANPPSKQRHENWEYRLLPQSGVQDSM
jgi:hypothetical protein